eukprot:6093472-Prymnesium_polylepis.1
MAHTRARPCGVDLSAAHTCALRPYSPNLALRATLLILHQTRSLACPLSRRSTPLCVGHTCTVRRYPARERASYPSGSVQGQSMRRPRQRVVSMCPPHRQYAGSTRSATCAVCARRLRALCLCSVAQRTAHMELFFLAGELVAADVPIGIAVATGISFSDPSFCSSAS